MPPLILFLMYSRVSLSRSIKDIQNIIAAGAEKVIINSYAAENPDFIKEASEHFGSSTISVCIDVKKKRFTGMRTWTHNGKKSTNYTPTEFALKMEEMGAGELIIQSIEQDGLMQGYDLDLLEEISKSIKIPVVALGGASTIADMRDAYLTSHVNAVAAGSMFVYQSKKRGVLINYPSREEIHNAFI